MAEAGSIYPAGRLHFAVKIHEHLEETRMVVRVTFVEIVEGVPNNFVVRGD